MAKDGGKWGVGNRKADDLSSVGEMWRTPSSQEPGVKVDRLEGELGARMYDKETGRLAQYGITQQAKAWATPLARDWKGERSEPSTHHGYSLSLGHQAQVTSTAGGKPSTSTRRLNPRFVEWLMGLPPAWTDFAPLGIQLSRFKRLWRSYLSQGSWS